MRHDPKQTVKLISSLAISDLTMIAVGVADYSLSELNLIATDKKRHVFTAKNFDKLLELVTSLRRNACKGEFTYETIPLKVIHSLKQLKRHPYTYCQRLHN